MDEMPRSQLVIGLGGARRNACIAICDGRQVLAACEQERVTRARAIGWQLGFPEDALEVLLRTADRSRDCIARYATAEDGIATPDGIPCEHVVHHCAHAVAALATSPFAQADVLVCDRNAGGELSAWHADRRGLRRGDLSYEGPGLASIYSRLSELAGLAPQSREHVVEALARSADGNASEVLRFSIRPEPHGATDLERAAAILRELSSRTHGRSRFAGAAKAAAALQARIGEMLLDILRDLRRRSAADDLCLGGGLFYNAYLTTLVQQSGLYQRVFVPLNPGNPGLAIGAALSAAGNEMVPAACPLTPFLGPAYDDSDIKATLDNCKLVYDCPHSGIVTRAVEHLAAGRLVGWFQGRMEWGPRALGNRSILASPLAPFALENLNVYLKHREPFHGYGLLVCPKDLDRFFAGPPTSDFMQHEYSVRDPELFRHILPATAARVRVQTLGTESSLLRQVVQGFGQVTGVPVLVNTSFNGFREPIVCTPRDAVRVFFGTGLDVLIIGPFVLQK